MNTAKVISIIILALLAYPIYAWVKYSMFLIRFRNKLKPGSRIKFQYKDKTYYGEITGMFSHNTVSVKVNGKRFPYFIDIRNIYPRIGK